MNKLIFVTSEIKKNHGGLTASLLKKASMLESYGLKSTIVTFNLENNYDEIIDYVREEYNIGELVEFVNINDYFKHKGEKCEEKNFLLKNCIFDSYFKGDNKITSYFYEGIKSFEVNEKNEIKEYTFFDLLVKTERIDVLNDVIIRRTKYDHDGKIQCQQLYDDYGYVYCTRWFSQDGKITSVDLFEDRSTWQHFNSFEEFQSYFLVSKLVGNKPSVVVSETRKQDSWIIDIKSKNIKKVIMTHSIHIRPGTDIIRLGNRSSLNNLNKIDALILLTNKQKEDIQKRFGARSNYYVIPHAIAIPRKVTSVKDGVISLISRLDENKRIDQAIHAMRMVVDKYPNAILNIYGEGTEENSLRKLISKLNLNQNVFLKGHVYETDPIYQESELTILTTAFEGFGLVIQESLANGTPVVSYDIKYGPSDMIENSINGYLIEDGNVEELAKKICNFMGLGDLEKRKMRKAAEKSMDSFSVQKFVEKWKNLILKVEATQLEEMTYDIPVLQNIEQISQDKFVITIRTRITADRNAITATNFYFEYLIRSEYVNKEINEVITAPVLIKKNEDIIEISSVFDTNKFNSTDIYDLNLVYCNHNNFFRERIGKTRDNFELPKGKKVIPYYTNPYDNVSFKVTI